MTSALGGGGSYSNRYHFFINEPWAKDALSLHRWMNRLGLAAIGYTPDDKVPRPDEGEPRQSYF